MSNVIAMRARRRGSILLLICLVLFPVGCTTDEGGAGSVVPVATSGQSAPTTTEPAPTVPESTLAATTLPLTTEPPPTPLMPFTRLDEYTTTGDYSPSGEGLALWLEVVPRIEDVGITSTLDGSEQPALWLPPPEQRPAPLLVVVHSWSSGYLQSASIPFAAWADANGWAMVAPDFRGVNASPEATGSDLAVQDVVDAIDFAVGQGDIDQERVFVIGFSGGGMMSLLVAGRHPERFAGAVSWVPVYDLVDWYVHVRDSLPDRAYAEQIVASCGGDPSVPGEAQESCRYRSPRTHLGAAAEAGLPVYIGQGVTDEIVPPSYAVLAFDQLAQPADRLGDAVAVTLRGRELPENLRGSVETETFFEAGEPEVLFGRTSGPVTFVVFAGGHGGVYHPGLAWIYSIAA